MGNRTARIVANAFINGKRMKKGNYFTDGSNFVLFGNTIARKGVDGIQITDCGWCSATTCTALNALPGVQLRRLKGEWIWNEKFKWDGDLRFIEI